MHRLDIEECRMDTADIAVLNVLRVWIWSIDLLTDCLSIVSKMW